MSTVIGTAIIDLKADTTKLVNGMDRAERSVKRSIRDMKKSIISLAASVGGIYAVEKAFKSVIETGFKYNQNMENSIAGLTALTVATSSSTTALGKHLTIVEKYNMAQKEAIKTSKELARINAETPHTLTQTNQIYKAMYVSMKKAGASTEQMIQLTKKISIAAGSAGVEFNQLLAGVDGLATGTVLANSDFGRFLNGLGLTNQKLKESKDVVGLLIDKFKEFKAVDTMTVAVSNLDNAWSQLTGDLTKSAFVTAKQDIKDLTSFLNDSRDGLVTFTADIGRSFDLLATRIDGYVVDIELAATKIALYNAKIANAVTFGFSKKTKDNIKAYKTEIKILEEQSKILTDSYKKTRYELGMMPVGLVRIDDAASKLALSLKNIGGGLNDSLVKKTEEAVSVATAGQKVWEDYYKSIGDAQTAWLVSDDRSKAYDNAILLGLKGDDFTKYIKRYEDNFLKPLQKAIDSLGEGTRTYSNPLADITQIDKNLKQQSDAYLTYYETIGAYSSAWALKEEDIRSKYAGLLSPDEIDTIVAKYKTDYFKPLEDMSKTTASYMENVFDTMSQSLNSSFESFFDYTSKGFMNFGDLVNSVINDVYMQIMKASVINPMVSGIMGGITSLFTPTNVAPNLALSLKGYAHGDVFGATPFATGGAFTNSIVTEPTYFAYGDSFGSNLGVMGEAGSEAVMPLTRVGSDLGVKSTPSNVIINVENQSGTPVDIKKVDEFMNDDGTKTINIVMNAIERNPDFRSAIKGIR